MRKLLERLFDEEGRLGPRSIVASGLVAWGLVLLLPALWGAWAVLAVLAMVAALALVTCAALRELLPVLDPRDAEADRFVSWGAALLMLAVGAHAFGIWFLPALALGAALVWVRTPELYEVFPWFEKPGDTGLGR